MSQDPKRVVILGGGFGGVYTALALEKSLRGRDDGPRIARVPVQVCGNLSAARDVAHLLDDRSRGDVVNEARGEHR